MASTVQFVETPEVREVVISPSEDVPEPAPQELAPAGSFDDSDEEDEDEVGDLSANGFATKVNLNYTVSSYRGGTSSK
jgi:hypothetical protein